MRPDLFYDTHHDIDHLWYCSIRRIDDYGIMRDAERCNSSLTVLSIAEDEITFYILQVG